MKIHKYTGGTDAGYQTLSGESIPPGTYLMVAFAKLQVSVLDGAADANATLTALPGENLVESFEDDEGTRTAYGFPVAYGVRTLVEPFVPTLSLTTNSLNAQAVAEVWVCLAPIA